MMGPCVGTVEHCGRKKDAHCIIKGYLDATVGHCGETIKHWDRRTCDGRVKSCCRTMEIDDKRVDTGAL